MARSWREAFFLQAASDYRVARRLQGYRDLPSCHWIHFLQMATEKMARGYRARPAGGEPPRTHRGFLKFVRKAASRDPHLRSLLKMRNDQCRAFLKSLAPLADQIEKLAPALAGGGPNAEYPWPLGPGCRAPVEYDFPELSVATSPHIGKLFDFLDKCFLCADDRW